ncbi:uncharacterized protein [Watersipora subatra]|uniref:uncharacterized protein n=1 Tax=Watersipora subatra TaxID=2589382 RepID=UPI00355BE5CB
MFEGPLFIGGHDDFSQLPWHIYSEAGFVGCINDLQINTLSSDLRELYQNQGARNIQDNCQAFMDYCGRNPCENSAPCYNHKDRYECDCSGLDHADFENDVCAKLTLIGNINGSEYYDLDLGRMYKTHVNDFSTRFKTTSKDGTMWMTHGQESYIKAFFEEGVLKVALNTGTKSYEWETKGRYNDYEWHTLDVQRRADYMAIFVDGIHPCLTDTIQSENFYIYMDEIRLGADTPNPGEPPYFFGHMRNFRWPDGTDGTPPFVDERPEPIPTPSITFINTESYMKVPTASGEMEKDLKLKLMIKTKIKDAIFLYQDGIRGQYLAGTINDGRLNIKYNFGNGDKDIEVPADLSDDKWHLIELYRKQIDELEVVLDNSERLTVATPIEWPYEFKHSRTLYLGGIPSDIIPPESLKDIGGYMGCMAKVIKSSVLIDLYGLLLDRLRAFGKIERGCQPWNPCDETECQHGCQCDATNSACDNSMIPFTGAMCEERDEGFIFYINGNPGHIHFSYDNPFSPVEDTISFGFKACQPNGLFTKVFGGNEKEFIEIYLIDGNLEAKFQLGGNQPEKITLNGDFTDDWYTVQFKRNGMKATLSLLNDNGDLQQSETASLKTGDDRLDGLERVEIGSEEISTRQYEREYAGIITGFKHSSLNIFDIATGSAGNRVRYDSLGTKPERNPDSFICELSGGCGPDKQICKNYGVCQNNVCNCTLTAYIGRTCEDWPKGRYYGYDRFEAGIDSYRYPRPITTMEDYLAVGVMTDEKDGTIFRVENVDKDQYYHLKLVNGSVRLDYKLKDVEHSIQPTTDTIDSENDVYYVIRMNRTGSTITMTVHNSTAIARKVKTIANLENVPFESQHQIMTGGLMQQSRLDGIYEDAYGIVGGLYYNGLYIYDLSYTPSGDVSNAPDPYELNPRTDARCGICFNDGRSSGNKQCDCTYTSFGGLCCDSKDDLFGFQVKKQGGNAVLIYNSSMSARNVDDLAVSFRTAGGWEDGHIMKVESADKKYYIIIEIKNDKLQVRHKLGPTEQIELFDAVVRQQKDHRVRLHREGNTGYIQLDGSKRNGTQFIDAGIFQPNVIYVGGAYNGTDVTSGHYVKTKNNDDFAIVPHPWPNLCNKGSPDCDPTPPTYGGGGDIIYEIGPVGPGNPGSVVGLGPSGGTTSPLAFIGAIMGGLLFAAATAFAAVGMKPGFIALSNRFAGGAGKGPYIPVDNGKSSGFPVGNGGGSNYVVAVGMEEYGDGKGVGGGMGGGSQAGSRSQYEDSYTHESRFDATDGSVIGGGGAGTMAGGGAGYNAYNTSSTWYARNETLENQNQAYGGGSTIGGYGNGRAGYAGSVTGGSVAGGSVYGFGTVTNPDQAFITLSEDIAVDNVVLTADGRYVVTGSNLGPPQVWNTMNGEMVTTMRGDHMGSTGLHLAANEQYLIGETMAEQAAVDMNDIQTGNHIPIRRVAVWDFNTGNPLPIAVDQLCTASCVSKDGLKVVMAMTDKFGGGTTIKVLDLLSNKVLHEVTYPDTIGVADSASCVFISPDDRFVAVGFVNSFDNNANFIVFDLFNKSGVVDSPIVALNADPHCTVILRNDEALTGTKNGELVIWSMKTGKAQRQLTSGDTTMLSQGGMPAAHDREVKEVSLSDDGKYLASASADRTVKVWNMESESLIHTLHGHNDEVYTVDIASDNTIIVSGSQDGTIKLWRLRNGNQITSFNATMDIFHARFSKDKKTVVALGDKYGARKLIMLQIVSQKKWRMRSS